VNPMDISSTKVRAPRINRASIVCLHLTITACLVLVPVLSAQTASRAGASDPLRQLSSSVEALVKRVSPSVVQVLVTGYGHLGESSRSNTGLVVERQRSLGSGVIIDPEGYIVTNAHVVSGAQRVQVVVPPPATDQSPLRSLVSARGQTVEARIIGIAREIDLAVLKIEAKGLPALPLGNYNKLRQGEMVFAFGSPEGLWNSVTTGVVSAAARQLDPDSPMVYIQTDAPINPGNSGGPLVNVDGELVGINTFILTESGGNQGLGFAIPSDVVGVAYRQFRKYGHLHRGEIGVEVQTITPNLAAGLGLPRDWGLIVSDVLPGGPADAAGLKVLDIIISLNDRPVDSLPLFAFHLFTRSGGERVKLGVLRGSGKLFLDVPVVERPHELDRVADLLDPAKSLVGKLGILGVEVDSQNAEMLSELRVPSGVIVAARAADSPNADASLAAGDVIHSINGVPVSNLESLRSALNRLKPNSPVVLQIEREERLMFVAFQLD
jgi:serine protease Do